MLATITPIVAFLLILIIVIGTRYIMGSTVETFSNSRVQDETMLKQIEMHISKQSSKDKERVDRLFKAYWKVSKESAQEMVVNPFDETDIPAWVKTEKDAEVFVPYILPYMLGKTDKLPETKEAALAEHFTSDSEVMNKKEFDLDTLDTMEDEELEETLRNHKTKDMTPKEAEKQAYKTLHHLANSDFDDNFYNSLSYVVMSFTKKAAPDASPEDIRNLGVEMKQSLPASIQQLQMEARSIMRKVEAAKRKDTKQRKSKTLAQLRKPGHVFRLDREGYMKSLPEYKRIMMEGFTGTKEGFGLVDKIIGKIVSPIVNAILKGFMPVITGFIELGIKTFVNLLPTIVNSVFIPLVNTIVTLITTVLSNKNIMKAITNIIQKLITLSIDIGYKIIQALSIPIMKLFFQYVMPVVMYTARFFIFIARMAARLAVTVWNLIVGFVKKNWSYIVYILKWTSNKVMGILRYVYNFVEPYIAYAMYIITPVVLIGLIAIVGPALFQFLGTLLSLGLVSTPERTFMPTKAVIDGASG